jgi:DNA polymerase-3 subunit epsilon
MPGYAVVDVETTGFAPGRGDRIVEIGIVLLDAGGAVEDTWETLLDPGRDLGPQHVHGIAARDVRDAPTFADVAGELAPRLAGRVFAAHNESFDRRFVAAEFDRLGASVPLSKETSLCTMRWGKSILGAPGPLGEACGFLGIELAHHHSAFADAVAATRILQAIAAEALADPRTRPRGALPWRDRIAAADAAAARWPRPPTRPVRLARRGAHDATAAEGSSFATPLRATGSRDDGEGRQRP